MNLQEHIKYCESNGWVVTGICSDNSLLLYKKSEYRRMLDYHNNLRLKAKKEPKKKSKKKYLNIVFFLKAQINHLKQ